MNWLAENWTLLLSMIFIIFVIMLCIIGVGFYVVKKFTVLPTDEQIKRVKAYLLCIVIEAEKLYGSKTGQLKLSWAYKCFAETFPSLVPIISFELFSKLVDEALVKMRQLLESNEAISNFVNEGK